MSTSEPMLIQDARGLSSGTLAGLIGSTRYAVIDAVQVDAWSMSTRQSQKALEMIKIISSKKARKH